MSQRCVAGGCSNTRSDGVSLHKWPEDPHFASLWTIAVKNTRSDFVNPINSSRLCSIHFATDSFEEQSVLAKSMGLKMKALLKYNAVPSMFDTNPPVKKKQRLAEEKTFYLHKLMRLARDHQNKIDNNCEEHTENGKLQGYVLKEI